MQRNFRKTMSFMLALVMVFSLIPFQAFAADSTSPVNTGLLVELQTTIDEILARYSITKQMSTAEVYNAVYAMDDYWTPMGALITPIITAKNDGTEITDEMLQQYLDALCTQIAKKAE